MQSTQHVDPIMIISTAEIAEGVIDCWTDSVLGKSVVFSETRRQLLRLRFELQIGIAI